MKSSVSARGATVTAAVATLLLATACMPTASGTPSTSAAAVRGVPDVWPAVIDLTAIPLGDGRAVGEPTLGSLYSCRTEFTPRGPANGGPWIDYANGTWDLTSKAQVPGSTTWPQAQYSETVTGDTRRISTDNLPIEDVTGDFPISPTSPVHEYDRNPNMVSPHVVDLSLPADPTHAASPSCVGMGAVGVLLSGVYLYNAVDAAGGDAVAHETQDVCDGHPDGQDFYHYHDIPRCLLDATPTSASTLVGYALDGYGIYVERDSNGDLPTNAELDDCHGRVSTVSWNGEEQDVYHYSATREFPFTIGCYRGTPVPVPNHHEG